MAPGRARRTAPATSTSGRGWNSSSGEAKVPETTCEPVPAMPRSTHGQWHSHGGR